MSDGAEDEGPPLEIDGAAEAMADLRAAAEETAEAVDAAFARAGSSLAASLARAAADGEVSLSELARALIGTLNAAFGAGRSGGGGAGGGLLDGLIGGIAGALAPLLGGVFGARGAGAARSMPESVRSGASLVANPVGAEGPPATPGAAFAGLVMQGGEAAEPRPVATTRPELQVGDRGHTTPGLATGQAGGPDWAALARAMDRPGASAVATIAEPRRSEPGRADAAPAPRAGAPVVVNVSVVGGAEALLRSEAQIAQTLARAASLGARRL